MRSTENSQDNMALADWTRCPPGELQRLVGKLNVIEHCAKRKRICFCGAGAMLLVVGLVVGVGTLLTPKMSNLGGLTCQQCQSHFVAYHDHLTDSSNNETTGSVEMGKSEVVVIMDSALAEKMKTHLANCKRCRERFNTQYPGVLADHRNSNLGRLSYASTIVRTRALFAVARVPAAI